METLLSIQNLRDLLSLARDNRPYRDGVHWAMSAVHVGNIELNRLLLEETRGREVNNMIADLSRGEMAELLGLPADEERSHLALTMEVRAAFQAGSITREDITAALAGE